MLASFSEQKIENIAISSTYMCAEGALQVTEDAASYIKSSFWSIKMGSIFGFIDYCVGYAFYRATEVKIKQVKENRMRALLEAFGWCPEYD